MLVRATHLAADSPARRQKTAADDGVAAESLPNTRALPDLDRLLKRGRGRPMANDRKRLNIGPTASNDRQRLNIVSPASNDSQRLEVHNTNFFSLLPI